MELSLKTNFPDVMADVRALPGDVGAKALASAVNKGLDQARTAMSREIRAEFNITADKVNAALRVQGATYKGGIYQIVGWLESPTKRGRSINVIAFSARQTSRGVTVKIKKQGGRQLLAGAFIGNQGRTVFTRMPGTVMGSRSNSKGKLHREQIKAVQTIDVAQMFNTRRINGKIVQLLEGKLPQLYDHEAKFYLDRFNSRRAH